MSFILDALKKSEADRLRKDAPGIANIPERGRQRSTQKWIWLVLALVTVNLVVLAGLMFKVDQGSSSGELPVEAMDSAVRAVPSSAANTADVMPDREQGEPLVAIIEANSAVDQSAETSFANGTVPTSVATAPRSTAIDNSLQSFNDLRARGALMLPDLHLDIHVYSGNAADRFVFVNMTKYKENATLSEGPIVSEITPDGVILNYQGTSFLLPRE
jgi:general secretion pathway protein B